MSTFHFQHNRLVLLLGFGLGIFLIMGCTPTPTPTPTPTFTPRVPTPVPSTPTPLPSPTPSRVIQFKITSPTEGTEFPGDISKPIIASGTHNLSADDHVWVFLTDIFGGYFLQNPSVELFSSGKWEATGIRIGKEIRYIVALYVNSEGHNRIKGWVAEKRFGKIPAEEVKALPGYRELDRVRIKTPGSE